MSLDLFAGIYISDFDAAKAWYVRLLGSEPSFFPNDIEAVWELAEHRWLYILQNAEHAGHSVQAIISDDDLDGRVARIAERGIEPAGWETYPNNVRKVLYHDPDGNEIGFGSVPSEP